MDLITLLSLILIAAVGTLFVAFAVCSIPAFAVSMFFFFLVPVVDGVKS